MDIQWFPTEAEAEFGIAQDDRIIWTTRGLKFYADDFRRYGLHSANLTDLASLREAFKIIMNCGAYDLLTRLTQRRKTLSPHSNAFLENQWLSAIITGQDAEIDRLRKKHAVRRSLNLVSPSD